MNWVLILVTALSANEFKTEVVRHTETMAECYFESTKVDFDMYRKANQELLCMRIEE